MAAVTDDAIETVEKFLRHLKNANINIDRALLFGSYAMGNAGKWSDMDVAIVSPDFSGTAFYDSKKLLPYLIKVDSRIEIHPFRPEDFTEDNPFVREILKQGVEIEL